MEKIFSTAKVPKYGDSSKSVRYEPDIVRILAESNDPKEMEYYWTQFRAQTGDKMRALYLEYVDLTNKAARYVIKAAYPS